MRTLGMMIAVVVLMSGLIGCAGTGWKEGTAQQPPKPPPEQKKFDAWMGTWSYEGEGRDSPLGPAGKFTGKCIGRPILNGFFFELRLEEKDWQSVQIHWYDAGAKTYRHIGFQSDGRVVAGTGTWNGVAWSAAWTTVHRGVEYRGRSQIILAADGKSITNPGELSVDGKTWMPFCESKWTKISDVPAAPPDFYASKPKPEMNPLEVLLGTWKAEEEVEATPLGPAGKYTTTATNRWILDGFFSEGRITTDKNEHWLTICWYDPKGKCFQHREFDDNGMAFSGTIAVDGNHWTGLFATTVNGVDYRFKYSTVVSDDKKTFTGKSVYSTDGKTWKSNSVVKHTKISEP